jgi:hypothetical protein
LPVVIDRKGTILHLILCQHPIEEIINALNK